MSERSNTFTWGLLCGMATCMGFLVVVLWVVGNPQDTICDLRLELAISDGEVVGMLEDYPHCAHRLDEH